MCNQLIKTHMKTIISLIGIWGISSLLLCAQLSHNTVQAPPVTDNAPAILSPKVLNLPLIQTDIAYPEFAQAQGIEGEVVFRVLVNASGNYVKHSLLASPHPELTRAIMPHLARLSFTPAQKAGKFIPVWTTVSFRFTLTDEMSPQVHRQASAKSWEAAAQAWEAAGNFEQALFCYQEAIQRTPEPAHLYMAYTRAAVAHQDYVRARTALTTLMHETADKSRQADIRLARAAVAALADAPDAAIHDYTWVWREMPNHQVNTAFISSLLSLSSDQAHAVSQNLTDITDLVESHITTDMLTAYLQR